MARKFLILAGALAALVAQPLMADAGETNSKNKSSVRRGGYSYSQADSINTYGDSRGKFGSTSSLRDPGMDRQTNAGPFDHGFFYDSGVGTGQHGNDAPFLH